MHVILGSGGVIARELSLALASHVPEIRQVSRNPKPVNASDSVLAANLLDKKQVREAVRHAEVVHLVAGLAYDTPTWQRDWPILMENVIEACEAEATQLVFFDNVYAYGLVNGQMTEKTPYNPCSKKGEVRAKIATMMMEEVSQGKLMGMIVRAADFYGSGATNSFSHFLVFDRIQKRKAPQWMGNPDLAHSFTYTPDAGRATAMLSLRPSAYGQVWHLPTDPNMWTIRQFIAEAIRLSGESHKLQIVPSWIQFMLNIFIKALKENHEMRYQMDFPYLFNSDKYFREIGKDYTPYTNGISHCLSIR